MENNQGASNSSSVALVERLQQHFSTGATRSLHARRRHLHRLREALRQCEPDLLEALKQDLGKSPQEAYLSELAFVHSEIDFALRHLRGWMRPRRRPAPRMAWPSRAWEQWDPQGVVLIIAPWNYPLQLLLTPLVSALAAGNCVCLKPSELAPHTARAVCELIAGTFAGHHVAVVEGGADQTSALLATPFDHVFFTGSTRVGKLIMQKAAAHPSRVTLELGGKCPCIVCADAPLRTAARRLLWGKLINAGQTCTAPDLVYVERSIAEELIAELVSAAQSFHAGESEGVIVNQAHAERLAGYINEGKTVYGGGYDIARRRVGFTILTDLPPDATVLQEEVFGPILPVVPFDSIDALSSELANRPSPLALYLFSRDRRIQASVMERVRSGGVCLNSTVSHMLGKHLPFGGVGASGMGRYHGRAGFRCFSQQRSVVKRSLLIDLPFLYEPVTPPLGVLRHAARWLLGR